MLQFADCMAACLEDSMILYGLILIFDKISNTTCSHKICKLVFMYNSSAGDISQKMLNFELYYHYHVCDVNAVAGTNKL